MRKRLIVICLAVFAASLAAGCGGGSTNTGDAEVDKALDEMKFEKAPTLGPLLRKCMVAIYKGDGGFLWDNTNTATHNWAQKNLDDAKKNPGSIDEMIKLMEGALADAKNDADKERAQAGVDYFKTLKNRLPNMDAREYFTLAMEFGANAGREDAKKDMLKNKQEIVGEEIAQDGNTGSIKIKDLNKDKEEKLAFAKEDGDWKFDLAGQASSVPSAPVAPSSGPDIPGLE